MHETMPRCQNLATKNKGRTEEAGRALTHCQRDRALPPYITLCTRCAVAVAMLAVSVPNPPAGHKVVSPRECACAEMHQEEYHPCDTRRIRLQ